MAYARLISGTSWKEICLIATLLSQARQFREFLSSLSLSAQPAFAQIISFYSNIPHAFSGQPHSISLFPYNVLASYAVLLKELVFLLLRKYNFPVVNCGFQHLTFKTLWLKPGAFCLLLVSIPDIAVFRSTTLTWALHFLMPCLIFIGNS